MPHSIGQTIKKLRKEHNFTQEELAEQLNITAQAVSRWENETSLPDISQVVPIANQFGVSTDVLFGTFGADNEEAVREIIEKASEPMKTAHTNREVLDARRYKYNILNDALIIYPNNITLLNNALSNGICLIDYCKSGNDDDKASIKEISDECVRMGNVILKYCNDINTIIDAHTWMVSLYTNIGDYSRAKEHTDFLPADLWSLRGPKLARVQHEAGELDAEIETRCHTIFALLRALESDIAWLGRAYRDKGQIRDAYDSYQTFYDVMGVICKNEHDHLTSFFIDNAYHEDLALWTLALGRADEALDWLERMYDDKTAIAENWKKGIQFDSPLLSAVKAEMLHDVYHAKKDFIPFMNNESFDSVRDTERFRNLFDKVNALPN